ncbi:MAG: type II toxin-antitoxin system RelE/ParE family toxin [Bacteroidales bacterium]|nr:type II toxin-antitoxin system RelE/ParE family toxin [Bacteroidales bacterium]
MTWQIRILRGAIKQLEALPAREYKSVKAKILSLAENPRPAGSQRLKGRPGYRVRQGNYRIIYDVFDQILTVEVIRIGHRKNIYK